jgi:D-threo-aldose 1-dehydrogenase
MTVNGGALLTSRPLGSTGLRVTPICVGGGPLGSMPENFGYDVSTQLAVETVRRVLAGPINFLDTAAGYSGGESERRIGAALADAGGLPAGFVLATKVDRDDRTGDFSGDQVRRSVEGSLERLGLDHLQLLHLHDPEHVMFEAGMAAGGPVEALLRLQEEGVTANIGVAGGPVELMSRYIRTGAFQVLLTHNRWTLVDRCADRLLDEAGELGVAVVNGAPFGGGILAKGTAAGGTYAYRPADELILRRIRAMELACAAHDVPLAAAALQFSIRDPRITSTIAGISRPERVDETVRLASWDIPDELWQVLERLAAPAHLWQW